MFAIVVHERGRSAWRKAFATREVRIGMDAKCDVVIAGASAFHARLVLKDGKYIIVDLKSDDGTSVNGKKIKAPQVVKETDTIGIGTAHIAIETLAYEALGDDVLAATGTERDLLDAIANGDDASRLVYADWLEAHNDPRAEVLRSEDVDRVRELVSQVDLPWRSRVLKLAIENCARFEYACPKQWSQLAATGAEGVRHCGACAKNVYYCATIDEARGRAARGECVAIDIASPRWPGDLDGPFAEAVCEQCDLDVGERLSYCPRCGARVRPEMMMLGRMA